MIILGIDPGSQIAGWGLINKQGNSLKHLDNGILDLRNEKDFSKKLKKIFLGVQDLIKTYQPQSAVVENVFYSKNARSALKLGQARGAAIAALASSELPVFEYTPLEIKQAVSGYGRAPKEQVSQMVRLLLSLPEIAEENASDALAAAICHANTFRMDQKPQI